jgi:hypothetical protein
MDTDKITIGKLPLRALHDDPHAFSEPLDKALAYPDERWKQRAAEAYNGKESFIVFARHGDN